MPIHCVSPEECKRGLSLSTGMKHKFIIAEGRLEIVTDTPFDERDLEDDVYELQSTDGVYQRNLSVADDSHNEEGFAALEFQGMPTNRSYTLTVRDADGADTLCRAVPYEELVDTSPALAEDDRYQARVEHD